MDSGWWSVHCGQWTTSGDYKRSRALSHSNNYKNGIKAVESIKCPTLFIFGELDKMITVDKGKKFAALVPNSKIHVIKNCGHMIMLENAFEMREKVVEFLKK